MTSAHAPSSKTLSNLLMVALALSCGAALSLGLTRFAYALLLPPMRADLGWTYSLAGLMNTANAVGYLLGALTLPYCLRRTDAAAVFVWGCVLAALALGVSGFFRGTEFWLIQRCVAGIFSAWVFMAGGILAARLSSESPQHSGLLLGVYYGGVGFGIIGASLTVPWVAAAQGWAWGWWVLTAMAVLATAAVVWPARLIRPWLAQISAAQMQANTNAHLQSLPWRALLPCLLAYTCFGLGYIGYMTFIIADLREQGASTQDVVVFYTVLGFGVVCSSRLWAGLLTRFTDGKPMAALNAMLGLAVMLAALRLDWWASLASGLLFGAVFLSVVASTTALVRHQLPQVQWTRGITLFTVVFAVGQIVGPTVVGMIADGAGSLVRGFVLSASTLWVGALLALLQAKKLETN